MLTGVQIQKVDLFGTVAVHVAGGHAQRPALDRREAGGNVDDPAGAVAREHRVRAVVAGLEVSTTQSVITCAVADDCSKTEVSSVAGGVTCHHGVEQPVAVHVGDRDAVVALGRVGGGDLGGGRGEERLALQVCRAVCAGGRESVAQSCNRVSLRATRVTVFRDSGPGWNDNQGSAESRSWSRYIFTVRVPDRGQEVVCRHPVRPPAPRDRRGRDRGARRVPGIAGLAAAGTAGGSHVPGNGVVASRCVWEVRRERVAAGRAGAPPTGPGVAPERLLGAVGACIIKVHVNPKGPKIGVSFTNRRPGTRGFKWGWRGACQLRMGPTHRAACRHAGTGEQWRGAAGGCHYLRRGGRRPVCDVPET